MKMISKIENTCKHKYVQEYKQSKQYNQQYNWNKQKQFNQQYGQLGMGCQNQF